MVNRPDKKEAVMDARSVSPKSADDDLNYEINLRPRGFDEYIGQEQVKENLRVAIAAARGPSDVLGHRSFRGPRGLGKTSLAYIIAREMDVNIKAASGPVVERHGDLARPLPDLEARDVRVLDA